MKWLSLLLFAACAAQAQQPLKPLGGAAAPALELASLDGAEHRLQDYRGRVVLVNFWATWCEPCREEMPSIERLRRSLDARRFAVLAVNVGEGPRAAGDFAEKMGLGFTFLLDRDTKVSRSWGARVLPATFVVGPDGKLRYGYYGAIDWSRADVRKAIAGLMVE
jgi:peroxiredoxin